MHRQLFETWNEPSGVTANFEWTNTSWGKYIDACNEGSKQVGRNLCFESIIFLYRIVHHVLGGTNYFDPNDTNNNKIRTDLVSIHDKGNEDQITVTDKDFATQSIILGNEYNTLLQPLNSIILFFNDGDPKVGWSKQYEWTATTGYAAFILQGIGNNKNDLNNNTFGLMYLFSADTMREITEELELEQSGYLPNSVAQYGIFLNAFGATVSAYNVATNVYSATSNVKKF